jgi:TonB-dependent SusC/RagA subfamily outer membrane receptor
MKITLHKLTRCSTVLLIFFWSTFASAQITASIGSQVIGKDEGKESPSSRHAQKSLKDFLSTLEKTFKVYFTFESSVVRDKQVMGDVRISDDLEETLRNALAPHKLKFEKVSENYYSIFKEGEPRPRQNDENNESSVPLPDSLQLGIQVKNFEIQQTLLRISGLVTDETGLGMPGVNIIEKGTTNGTVTNIEGRYTIDVESEKSVLVISFVGYTNTEEPVGLRTEINTQMSPDVQTLSEIVVVGYSTQERKNLTAAVNTIHPNQLENRPVTNMYQALQGLAPNLTIQQNVAEPGSVQTLNIRGVGSFTDNSPLIIVDGVNVGSLGLNYLNPNDVESITVLKDAASSAIYGSQAANGVIYITTRSGKKDEKMSVQYNGMFGLQSPTTSPKAVEGWEFMTLKNEALVNSGLPPQFTPQQIADQKEQGSYPWAYDEFVNNVAPQQNQSLSVTGGSKSTSYLLSAGYLNQQSMFNGQYIPDHQKFYYKRYNLRSNLSTQINKFIKFIKYRILLETLQFLR